MSAPAELTTLATTADVDAWTDRIAEFAADGWALYEGRVDWEEWLERFERYQNAELPGQMDDPVIRKIQRIARAAIREAGLC